MKFCLPSAEPRIERDKDDGSANADFPVWFWRLCGAGRLFDIAMASSQIKVPRAIIYGIGALILLERLWSLFAAAPVLTVPSALLVAMTGVVLVAAGLKAIELDHSAGASDAGRLLGASFALPSRAKGSLHNGRRPNGSIVMAKMMRCIEGHVFDGSSASARFAAGAFHPKRRVLASDCERASPPAPNLNKCSRRRLRPAPHWRPVLPGLPLTIGRTRSGHRRPAQRLRVTPTLCSLRYFAAAPPG